MGRWCACLALLCLGSLPGQSTALITPEQKQAMLCTDTCSLMTQKAEELDPTYTIFVLSNQDLGDPNAPLTSLRVRGSCIDYSAVEAVFPSNRLDSVEIYADTLDMSKATKLPDANSTTIHANYVLGSDDRDQVVRYTPVTLFSLLGYPQILEDTTFGTPGTSSTLKPQSRTWNLTFGYTDTFNNPLSFGARFQLPELRGVKVIWSNYTGGVDAVVDVQAVFQFLSPGTPFTPAKLATGLVMPCDDPTFVSINYTASVDIPWYCYRRFPVGEWAFALYVFDWAANVPPSTVVLNSSTPQYTPSQAVWTLQVTGRFPSDATQAQLHVASEVIPGITNIPTRRIKELQYRVTEPLRPYNLSGFPVGTLTVFCYWNTLERLATINDFFNLSTQIILTAYTCGPQRTIINVSSPSDVVGGSLAPLPLNRPDTDLSRLLLSCWSSTFGLPPYDATFENSLNTLINFFTVPGGSTPEGALWAEATKLYKQINTNFPSRQVSYPKLSYSLYTATLVTYGQYYNALSSQANLAMEQASGAQARLGSAQTAISQAEGAEVLARTNYLQLLAVNDEISAALRASLDTYHATSATIQPALDRFQKGLAQEEAIEIFQEITNIIENIVAVAAYVVKEDYFQAARYALQGISEAIQGGFEIDDLYKLGKEMANFVATVEAFQILGTNRGDGEELLALLQADVNLQDPNVFPDDVKQRLTLSTFQYNLGDIVNQELQLEAIRDQSQTDLAGVISKGVDGASELASALIQTAVDGLEALKLSIQYDEALNNAIVAGVQYLTAKLSLSQTTALVADIANEQQRVNELNFALFLQTYSVKTQLLRLLKDACDAFFFAAVVPCGLPADVFNGADEANLLSDINQLRTKFAGAVADGSRPQLVQVQLAYDNTSAEIQALRNNNTFTIVVPLSSSNFSRYWGIGLDSITLTFDNIRVSPPDAQVKVGIVNAGSSENRDESRNSFSFRGPIIDEAYIYVPGLNNTIITPGAIYPGDEYAYFKPSPFTTWQFKIFPRTVDSPTGSVDISQITGAYVTFQGRGHIYTSSGQFVAPGCRPQAIKHITKDYCTAIVPNGTRGECKHLLHKFARESNTVCAKDGVCGVSLLKRS